MNLRISWPGLILAPVFALADQSVAYAFVEWSCEHRMQGVGHIVHAVFLALTLATLFMALAEWRLLPRHAREDAGDRATRQRMVAAAGTLVALLCAWVIVSMWLPHLVLSPCYG